MNPVSSGEDMKMPQERLEESQPQCPYGTGGSCCRICYMGPCRVTDGEYGMDRGVCGAGPGTVAARNLYREIASGAASHADHAREIAEVLGDIAEGELDDDEYTIADPDRMEHVATDLGVETEGRDDDEIAAELSELALEDFSEEGEGTLNWIGRMPSNQREHLAEQDMLPLGSVDKTVSRAMHRTTKGNDAEPENILRGAVKAGLVDGYGGLSMGTDLQDIVFGTPEPTSTVADLGTFEEDQVNIAVNGHEPVLSEMIVKYAEELEEEAIEAGADGINVVGICCTGNDLAQRSDVPLAAHAMQAEIAITTGAVDSMVADIQCIWPGIGDIAECHHTKFITTIDYAQIPGAQHISFSPETAEEDAKEIIRESIEAFEDRNERPDYEVNIPDEKRKAVVGISDKFVIDLLSDINPESPSQPIVDAMESGDLRGIVGIVGCPNPKMRTAEMTERIVERLLENNVLPVVTGCIGHICAQKGYLDPAMVDEYAGEGLSQLLHTLGDAAGLDGPVPPVWHMGSCVDNSRIGNVIRAIAEDSGVPSRKLPVAASAPEMIAEKALSIGTWALGLGLPVHTAPTVRMEHSEVVTEVMTEGLRDITGGYLIQEEHPEVAANKLMQAVESRRAALFDETDEAAFDDPEPTRQQPAD